jgi:transcriptional regulator
MYVPQHFALGQQDALAAIRERVAGTIVVVNPGGFEATLIPWVADPTTLRGHVARPNPLARLLDEPSPCIVLFDLADAYVSPSWYPSKAEHLEVVPTWNYQAVHVHGVARRIDDAEWIRAQIEALTTQQETTMPAPWSVSDAPADFITKLAKGIVGLEVTIQRIEGKAKLSQNRNDGDRAGVVEGLATRPPARTVRDLMTAT